MKKYRVTIFYDTHVVVDVNADNEDDARALAYCEAGKRKYDNQLLEHVQAVDYSEVAEVEED